MCQKIRTHRVRWWEVWWEDRGEQRRCVGRSGHIEMINEESDWEREEREVS